MFWRHSLFGRQAISLLACSIAFPLAASAQLSFQAHSFGQTNDTLQVLAHGDFNGDGREDFLVIDTVLAGNDAAPALAAHRTFGASIRSGPTPDITPPSTAVIFLSNGDGTYGSPITLPNIDPLGSFVVGDFNGDGKLDIADAPIFSAPEVYLGNGDGTFQAGRALANYPVQALDLNHDGKTDLVESTQTNALQVWLSNGDGTFTAGQTFTIYNPGIPSGGEGNGSAAGDFDGDGKPDLALFFTVQGTSRYTSVVQVFYGDGAGHLGSPFLMKEPNNYNESSWTAVDVNNDGRSDLVATPVIYSTSTATYPIQNLPKIAIFTGNANRTLSYLTVATATCPEVVNAADLNGDGRADLVYWESSCTTTGGSASLIARLGAGGNSFGAGKTIAQSVYGSPTGAFQPVVLRSTQGTKPDLLSVEIAGPGTNGAEPTHMTLFSNESTGAFPSCDGLSVAEGIQVCSPGATASSPVQFSFAAAGPTPMRSAAVWVDGKKAAEQLTGAFSNYSFLDKSLALAAGSHAVTLFGIGWDSTQQVKRFTLQVASGCTAPSSAGVNVCSPVNGSTVSSPVKISAAATVTGTLARMEVWVDGVKKYSETSSTSLTTSLSLAAGSHRFAVIAVNSTGTQWETAVNATVK
jgi:hypothetical protein